MKQYLEALQHIKDHGVLKENRTGIDTISVFGYQMRFNLQDGFPLVTTKKVHMKSIIYELLWFLKGDTNIKYLNDNGVKIWDEWADEDGNLGRVYGAQWRDWRVCEKVSLQDEDLGIYQSQYVEKSIDQISVLIDRLKTNPDCRRLIVTAWNPGELNKMALAPCHCLFQFNTRPLTVKERKNQYNKINNNNNREILIAGCDIDAPEDANRYHEILDQYNVPTKYLDCMLTQRSCDFPIGVPYNIASYALLTMMIAQCVNMVPGQFIWSGGDTHIYSNQLDGINEQLTRDPRPLPTMKINPDVKDIFSFKYEDFTLINYNPHPIIKMPVAV